jgi:flagellar hook assembly protein FlgD
MSEIDPLEGLRGFASQEPTRANPLDESGLGRDAFLKIFLTQLENQDPSAPEDASDLSQQLAVFSQLEQQVTMSEELRGIGEKLDKVIETLQSNGQNSELQPLSLLGKSVDLAASRLFNDSSGNSPTRLRFNLGQADAPFVLIEGRDDLGRTLGLGVVQADAEGRASLPRGSYELFLEDGAAFVQRPDGETSQLDFLPFIEDVDGRLLTVDAENPSAPLLQPLRGGVQHDFVIRAQGRDGTSVPLSSFVSGPVDGVRLIDGRQVLTVGGSEVEPSQLIQVR